MNQVVLPVLNQVENFCASFLEQIFGQEEIKNFIKRCEEKEKSQILVYWDKYLLLGK
jgi:hypothetical protein